MDVQTFLMAYFMSNVGFAIMLTAHAHLTDRDHGPWPFVALVIGLAGVAGYFFYEPENGI